MAEAMGDWAFYQDGNRAWRWRELSADGKCIKECATGWPSLEACMRDAQHHGMTSDHVVRFPRDKARKRAIPDKP
jgi:hypothetical protein